VTLAELRSRNAALNITRSRDRETHALFAATERATNSTPRSRQPHIKVRDANERRLGTLARQGIRVVLDAPEVLQFVLEQVRENWSERDFEREWVFHVSALLDQLDAECTNQRDTG
jgi:hypothetical protein